MSLFGPIFGSGHDICIYNAANIIAGSSTSNLGKSYQHPQLSQGRLYLAGSHPFLLSEIEVYQKK